jgi:hypothetical protein
MLPDSKSNKCQKQLNPYLTPELNKYSFEDDTDLILGIFTVLCWIGIGYLLLIYNGVLNVDVSKL